MEQALPASANRGSPEEAGRGRDDAGRTAARAIVNGAGPAESGRMLPSGAREVTAHFLQDLELSEEYVAPSAEKAVGMDPDEVTEFARTVVGLGIAAGFQRIDVLRSEGLSLESIYIELLGPTATHLGALWEDDLCDFAEVTIGLGRLQQILRELGPEFRSGIEWGNEAVNLGRRLLLVPASDGHHTLGIQMVADFFARAGWDVWGAGPMAGGDVLRMVRDEWFDVVGLAVGANVGPNCWPRTSGRFARRPAIAGLQVLVAGQTAVAHPDFAAMVGADAVAVDGRQALRYAERLIAASGGNK